MKKGFTLIELIAVIGIIGILSTLAIPKISEMMDKSSAQSIISEANLIKSGINRYYGHMGSFPYYLTLLRESPLTTKEDDSLKYNEGWDAFSVALTGNKGDDDPDLKESWGGPYLQIEESPDAQYCLKANNADSICFGAMIKKEGIDNLFSNISGSMTAPFNGGKNPTITTGKKSNGSDETSDAYYNVIQINGVSKNVAIEVFKILNKHAPTPNGNLEEVAKGLTNDVVGIPSLKSYSKFNRIIIRFTDNY